MKRKVLIAIAAVAVVAILAVTAGGWLLTEYAFNNSSRSQATMEERLPAVKKAHPETSHWLDSLQLCHALRDTFLTMPGGHRGHAIYVRSPRAHGRTALLVHGYKDSATGMLHIARVYNEMMGWNIVLPDLYAHGLSDGDYIRMGWLDRFDVMEWARQMEPALRSEGDSSLMVLHGVSMGAATVMYCSGDKALPKFVGGIVEDCGYVDVWTELRLELRKQFRMPAFPLLYSASAVNKMCHSWRIGEASAEESVARSTVPMLFIHGDADTFVPTWMVVPCFKAKRNGDKMIWIAPGSKHAEAYSDHPEEYASRVGKFVSLLQ